MKHQIHIGGREYVIDDPNGCLARPESHELKLDHPENEHVEVSLRAARDRQMSYVPNTADPIGSIRGRTMIYEALADGRVGLFGLFVCWVALGIPSLIIGGALLRWTFLHFHEPDGSLWRYFTKIVALIAVAAFPGLILNLLVRGTLGYFRKAATSVR